jgi:hypothetical protein
MAGWLLQLLNLAKHRNDSLKYLLISISVDTWISETNRTINIIKNNIKTPNIFLMFAMHLDKCAHLDKWDRLDRRKVL